MTVNLETDISLQDKQTIKCLEINVEICIQCLKYHVNCTM